jgi:hypothetical protein
VNRRGFLAGVSAAIAAACLPKLPPIKRPPPVTIPTDAELELWSKTTWTCPSFPGEMIVVTCWASPDVIALAAAEATAR